MRHDGRPPLYTGTDCNLGRAAKSPSKTAATVTDRELRIRNQPPFICSTKRDQTGGTRSLEADSPDARVHPVGAIGFCSDPARTPCYFATATERNPIKLCAQGQRGDLGGCDCKSFTGIFGTNPITTCRDTAEPAPAASCSSRGNRKIRSLTYIPGN